MTYTKNQELWHQIKKFYREKFGIEPDLVNLMADFDIMRLCASGSSTVSIAEFLGANPDDVADLLDMRLGFFGWGKDLTFSPLRVYNKLEDKNLESFRNKVVTAYGYIHNDDITKMYSAAELISRLEQLLDEKWI